MAACKGLKKDGTPCGMRPPAGQDFCLNHGGKAPEKKPAAAKSDPPAKVATKGPPASQERADGSGWGVALGAFVGLAIAGALVYAARRYIGAKKPAGNGGGPRLAAVPG